MVRAGHYVNDATGTVIKHKPRQRVGRNGYVLAGWAIIVDGRETMRYPTLAAAIGNA